MLSVKIREALMALASIEAIEERWAKLGEACDYFYAFFACNGEVYSLNVRYVVPPNSWYFIGRSPYYKNEIYLTRFARTAGVLRKIEETRVGEGADPRVASDGANAYGIITRFNNPGWGATLYDFGKRRLTPITMGHPSVGIGKNWQPYLSNGELFAVHEMTPLRIVHIDVHTGTARMVAERDLGFNLYAFYESYPMFRGGGNAMQSGSEVVGLGRTTSQRYRHQPFLWFWRGDHNLNIEFSSFFHAFNRVGYNVIDPTSMFFEGEDLLVGLCCSERDWAHEQSVLNVLLRFSPSREPAGGLALSTFLDGRPKTEAMRAPLLDRHIFFCLELPCAIASRAEHGGRVSTGASGHLVHGPYLPVDKEGRFVAELSYLTTRASPETQVGLFDVVASRPDGDELSDFRVLGRRDLRATNDATRSAKIEFDTTGVTGFLLEFRVYVQDGVELNAFHVRTSKIDASGSAISTP